MSVSETERELGLDQAYMFLLLQREDVVMKRDVSVEENERQGFSERKFFSVIHD